MTGAWQPMATAPKDGTVICAYRKDAGTFEAHYVSPAEMIASSDKKRAWFTTRGEDLTDCLPTHWMPLRAPPRSAP